MAVSFSSAGSARLNLPRHWVVTGGIVSEVNNREGVSPASRGLAYGDGLFETMRVHDSAIPLLTRHLARLTSGLKRLSIPAPELDLTDFLVGCCGNTPKAVLKLIVTRGSGGRGYLPDPDAPSQLIASLFPFPHFDVDYAQAGISVGISGLRAGSNPLLAGLKHLNRLEQVLIRMDLHSAGFMEGLVLDSEDFVIEGVSSNIGIWRGNTLATPSLDSAGVAGVARGWALEQATAIGYSVSEQKLRLDDIWSADEVFLCNSINGFWPVASIAGRAIKTGSKTRLLQEKWKGIFGQTLAPA